MFHTEKDRTSWWRVRDDLKNKRYAVACDKVSYIALAVFCTVILALILMQNFYA